MWSRLSPVGYGGRRWASQSSLKMSLPVGGPIAPFHHAIPVYARLSCLWCVAGCPAVADLVSGSPVATGTICRWRAPFTGGCWGWRKGDRASHGLTTTFSVPLFWACGPTRSSADPLVSLRAARRHSPCFLVLAPLWCPGHQLVCHLVGPTYRCADHFNPVDADDVPYVSVLADLPPSPSPTVPRV